MSQKRLNFRLPEESLTFEEFLCGTENLSVIQKAILMAENGRTSYQSPGLYLYGAPGTGKTHILSAIANGAGSLTAVLVNVRDLLDQLNDAWKSGVILDLRDYLIEPDIVLLDDLHLARDDDRFQDDVLTVIRLRLDANLSVAVTANAPPIIFDGTPLSSHLSSGPWDIAQLRMDDRELRLSLLKKFLGDFYVPEHVLGRIVEKEKASSKRLKEWAVGIQARRDLTTLLWALGYELASVGRYDGTAKGPVITSQWRLEIEGKLTVVDVSHVLTAGRSLYRCWCHCPNA